MLTRLVRAAQRVTEKKAEPMKAASIRRASMDAIVAQAEREFPFECCGFIIGDDENSVEEVRPVANIQNRMHAQDPAAFPRDARAAFLMEPKEHLAVMNEVDRRKLAVRAVYHSHPDHDAYFSPTDRAQACSFDPSRTRLSRHRLHRDVDSRRQIRARSRVRLGFRKAGVRRDAADRRMNALRPLARPLTVIECGTHRGFRTSLGRGDPCTRY